VDLHAERGHLDADIRGECLRHRGEERRLLLRGLSRRVSGRPIGPVEGLRGEVADAPRRAREPLHRHEHALDVRMLDDRAHALR
jgi:hypothetical protein